MAEDRHGRVHAAAPPLRPRVGRARRTGTSTRSTSSRTARCSRASCRPRRASTARSASAARAARRSAARAACASTASPASPATRTSTRAKAGSRDGVIEVEPMGNMPVIKDLIVDMDAVHWKKIQRVTPWLINKEPIPEREYIVPHENMVDVTQSMACIQCGACVSDCLSMEVDPLFIGPAALAKAYRFVGDPRDAAAVRAPQGPRRGPARHLRLHPLLQVHRGVPEGRRADEPDHAPAPPRRQTTTTSSTATTASATRRVRHARSATTACCTRPSCCRAPTAATRGSASSTRRPALELRRLAAGDHQGAAAPQGHADRARCRPQDPQGRTSSRSSGSTRRSRAATSATS